MSKGDGTERHIGFCCGDCEEDGYDDGIAEGRRLEREEIESKSVVKEIRVLDLAEAFGDYATVVIGPLAPGSYRMVGPLGLGGKE